MPDAALDVSGVHDGILDNSKMNNTQLERTFNQIRSTLFHQLNTCTTGQGTEHLALELTGEMSQFVRFNRARVRQTGSVNNVELALTLISEGRMAFREIPFTGDLGTDLPLAEAALVELRQDLPQLLADPYLVVPEGADTSYASQTGYVLPPSAIADAILPTVATVDFVGLYAGGSLIRAYADSMGKSHWFTTDSFTLDYSLFTPAGQAVKGSFAGSHWDQAAYEAQLTASKLQLEQMDQPTKVIPKGQYRTYLAPAAVAEIIGLLSWGAVSEAAIQRGGSALAMLCRGEKYWSGQFSLKENFARGLVPRFNDLGEVSPMELPLITAGRMVNSLISSRSAKEYGKVANGAARGEYLRSPEVAPGQLATSDILKTLDTGLYVSNLHYLNWSDRPAGRFTGMTRYACFWVANGEIVAPIENLRFDESLYRCFSSEQLLALTQSQEFIPEVDTYGHRQLGGIWVPGMVIEDFTYTL